MLGDAANSMRERAARAVRDGIGWRGTTDRSNPSGRAGGRGQPRGGGHGSPIGLGENKRLMPIRILLSADDHDHAAGQPSPNMGDRRCRRVPGLEAIEQAELHRPDIAVMDIAMKELNGIEATAQILPVAHGQGSSACTAMSGMRSGGEGGACCVPANSSREIIKAVHGLANISSACEVLRNGDIRLKDARDAEDPFDPLTDRERHVYQMLAEGNCNKEIANRLDLSLHTVETHRWRIMKMYLQHGRKQRERRAGPCHDLIQICHPKPVITFYISGRGIQQNFQTTDDDNGNLWPAQGWIQEAGRSRDAAIAAGRAAPASTMAIASGSGVTVQTGGAGCSPENRSIKRSRITSISC